MKIRKLTPDNYLKVSALLKQAFPGSSYEVKLVDNLHDSGKFLCEWVCVHRKRIIAYIAYSNAFERDKICGMHLAPIAVSPQFQMQGVGSELIKFSLKHSLIMESTVFVLGDPKFYKKFGFEHCDQPICPYDNNNTNFLSIRNNHKNKFTVGYESEFDIGV